MNPALLVIDVQKDFFHIDDATTKSLKDAVKVINAAIELFREKGLPVISIQHVDEEDNLVPGNPGFDLPDDLNILPDDLHIHKTYKNAFNKTELGAELKKMNANPLILTGFCAEACVLSTYRGAEDLDFKPILLLDSLASGDMDNINFVGRINEVISFGALKSMLTDL